MFEVKIITKQFEKVRKTRHQRIPREIKSQETEPIAFSSSHHTDLSFVVFIYIIISTFYIFSFPLFIS